MVLLYMIFAKLFPIIAVWEFKPHPRRRTKHVSDRRVPREGRRSRRRSECFAPTASRPATWICFPKSRWSSAAGVLDRPSRMSLVSVLGAITFGTAGDRVRLLGAAQLPAGHRRHAHLFLLGHRRDHLRDDDVGRIVATFAWFLWESGLIRKRDKSAPVPRGGSRSMCLRVRCQRGGDAAARRNLRRRGRDRRSNGGGT